MRQKILLVLLAAGLSLACASGVFAQDANPPASAEATEWQWGEVMSVDNAGKTLVLTYLDYDTDIEKQMTLVVDEATRFENVKSLEALKPQDTVSVDYIVAADGKNLAKVISLENIDDEMISENEEQPQASEKIESKPLSPADQKAEEAAGPG